MLRTRIHSVIDRQQNASSLARTWHQSQTRVLFTARSDCGDELSTCDAAATMADAWQDDRLTMQTLRDVYANLNSAAMDLVVAAAAGWPAARACPSCATAPRARRRGAAPSAPSPARSRGRRPAPVLFKVIAAVQMARLRRWGVHLGALRPAHQVASRSTASTTTGRGSLPRPQVIAFEEQAEKAKDRITSRAPGRAQEWGCRRSRRGHRARPDRVLEDGAGGRPPRC